jgi:hypothetical protein
MTTKNETAETEAVVEQPHGHHNHGTLDVVPIEQEANEDAFHVNLSWRSWV